MYALYFLLLRYEERKRQNVDESYTVNFRVKTHESDRDEKKLTELSRDLDMLMSQPRGREEGINLLITKSEA